MSMQSKSHFAIFREGYHGANEEFRLNSLSIISLAGRMVAFPLMHLAIISHALARLPYCKLHSASVYEKNQYPCPA